MDEQDFTNETIEKLLLKRSMLDKNWLNILSNVYDKRWFKVEGVGLVLKLVLNWYKKYNSIPSIGIIQALAKKYFEKSGADSTQMSTVQLLLSEVTNTELNIPEEVLNKNLKEFIRRNAFYNALYDNAEILDSSPESYQKVVDKCLENFDRVQKITFNDVNLGLDYFDETAMAEHWKYINNPEAKISTGWDSLDEFTNGGFLKDGKMLGLFMAQAGLGKSVFLSNLAVNFLKQGLRVVVISLEMSENVYATRFDAHISKKDINKLKENEQTAIQRIKDFYSQHPTAKLYIKEYPPRSIRPSDIQVYLENLKNAGKDFDVIIVDYLNLVLAQDRSDNMFKDGLAVSEKLRALSYIFGCPVISAVQSNTEGMNTETIGMENISESRGIAHTADFIAALYQTDEDRENGIINMRLLKNRLGGRVGKISNFKLDPETLNVADVTFDTAMEIDVGKDDETALAQLMKKIPNIDSDIDSDDSTSNYDVSNDIEGL